MLSFQTLWHGITQQEHSTHHNQKSKNHEFRTVCTLQSVFKTFKPFLPLCSGNFRRIRLPQSLSVHGHERIFGNLRRIAVFAPERSGFQNIFLICPVNGSVGFQSVSLFFLCNFKGGVHVRGSEGNSEASGGSAIFSACCFWI